MKNMEDKKYILTDITMEYVGHKLYRIKAVKNFSNIHKGDLGGWVEDEDNLSQEGECWIYHNAKVFDNAKLFENARVGNEAEVYGNAQVFGNAKIFGYVCVFGNAEICGDAEIKSKEDYSVFKNTWSSGRYFTWTRSNNMWRVGCFYGTGEELIAKAYKDSERTGKCYELIVKTQEAISNTK